MKRELFLHIVMLITSVAIMSSCGGSSKSEQIPGNKGGVVANHTIATDAMLRAIPVQYINAARTTLAVAYQHTSHGTHVSYGIYGLQDFKTGDSTLFGVTQNAATPDPNKLDFHDFDGNNGQYIGSVSAGDLSQSDNIVSIPPAFVQNTREYLENSANADINVVMRSWCSIGGHDITEYLTGMQTLINEYGPGGSQIGVTRSTPVTFVFMTGHADESGNNHGTGQPRDQAQLIIDYCAAHGYYCLDYYSIDTYDMNGVYHADATDNAVVSGGVNFYQAWQSAHTSGVDWFGNKVAPGGSVACGQHNTQHITANRKAYAFWWILARIAGWDGVTQ